MIIKNFIKNEQNKDYFIQLMKNVEYEYDNCNVFPSRENLFRTFELCSVPKVVIIGQDPYIHYGEAHGIAFSVYESKLPPSLKNIFKELETDLNINRTSGDLYNWCTQGVLMFNTIFTVREGESLSHKNLGWETFSENLITHLDQEYPNLIFILWGNNARSYKKLINNGTIIEGVHPSPLSAYRGFFGSKPFSKCNEILKELGKSEVDWR